MLTIKYGANCNDGNSLTRLARCPQDRLTRMNNAVSTMILTTLKPGTDLGIVEFSTSASLLSDLRTVTTEEDRKNLITMLPTSAVGWTSIGAGLQMGLEV